MADSPGLSEVLSFIQCSLGILKMGMASVVFTFNSFTIFNKLITFVVLLFRKGWDGEIGVLRRPAPYNSEVIGNKTVKQVTYLAVLGALCMYALIHIAGTSE